MKYSDKHPIGKKWRPRYKSIKMSKIENMRTIAWFISKNFSVLVLECSLRAGLPELSIKSREWKKKTKRRTVCCYFKVLCSLCDVKHTTCISSSALTAFFLGMLFHQKNMLNVALRTRTFEQTRLGFVACFLCEFCDHVAHLDCLHCLLQNALYLFECF